MDDQIASLQAQLATLEAERNRATADNDRLVRQMASLAVSDQAHARNVPLPSDPCDRETSKSFERATKLANVHPFSGDRKRALAFCSEITRLLSGYDQMETHEGFLYSTGRLAGDARIWYEFLMQTSPIYTWAALQPLKPNVEHAYIL